MKKLYSYIIHILVLTLFFGFYIWGVVKYCWTLPFPSDPCEYVMPVVWKTMWGHFEYFDRLMIPIGVHFFSLFISKTYVAAMAYSGVVNILIVFLGVFFCYRKGGFVSAIFAAVFLIASFFMIRFSSYLYPIQTMTLYSLLGFMAFFSRERKYWKPVIWAGVFSAFACFSKIVGIVMVVFFVSYLLVKKRPKELISYFSGVLAGTVMVVILTAMIFGFQSIVYMADSFMQYFSKSVTLRGGSTNLVSYLQLLISFQSLPVFLTMFVFVGAYRLPKARDLYFVAGGHIILLYIVYTFSTIGGTAITNYVYPSFVFASLGAAVYLGTVYEHGLFRSGFLKYLESKRADSIFLGVMSFICVVAGFYLAVKFNPAGAFELQVVIMPKILRWFYTLGPISLVGLLAYVEFSKAKKGVVSLLVVTAMWSSAYCGGMALHEISRDKVKVNTFYNAAAVLAQVPVERFYVYVREWNGYAKYMPVERVKWVYGLFFDQKYPRKHSPSHLAHQKNTEIIEQSIKFIYNIRELSLIRGPLLTDDLETVVRIFPRAQPLRKIEQDDKMLFVLNIPR